MKRPGAPSRRKSDPSDPSDQSDKTARRADASVMILALWALLLLSAAIFAWVKIINLELTVTGDRNNGLEAEALAHSGVMVALHPQVTRLTPLLTQSTDSNHGYKVVLTGEAGKLNLNWLFANPQAPDPARIALFKRYLTGRGLNLQQLDHLTDCILDWLTPGNIPRLNGAKSDADYKTPGRGAFLSVDELGQVKGSEPLVSQAGWQDDFTIYSSPGLIDLQSASLRVIESLPNVGEANAVRFLRYRQGPDGVDGTLDDFIFPNIAEALSYLGLSRLQTAAVGPFVEIENPLTTVHIRSTGQCGNVSRLVEVVARKQGMQPIILSWKEW